MSQTDTPQEAPRTRTISGRWIAVGVALAVGLIAFFLASREGGASRADQIQERIAGLSVDHTSAEEETEVQVVLFEDKDGKYVSYMLTPVCIVAGANHPAAYWAAWEHHIAQTEQEVPDTESIGFTRVTGDSAQLLAHYGLEHLADSRLAAVVLTVELAVPMSADDVEDHVVAVALRLTGVSPCSPVNAWNYRP